MATSSIPAIIIGQPWHSAPFQIAEYGEGRPVILKVLYSPSDQSCRILMSDLRDLWYEELSGDGVVMAQIRKLNPNIEADLTPLMEHVVDILIGRSPADVDVSLTPDPFSTPDDDANDIVAASTHDNRMLCVKFRSKLGRIPFRWVFEGRQMAHKVFLDQLVEPLVVESILARRRELNLIDLLHQKDEEIAAYRQSGMKLARKSIETKVFNATSWEDKQELPQDIITLASCTSGQDCPRDGLSQLVASADCNSRLGLVGALVEKTLQKALGVEPEASAVDVSPQRHGRSPAAKSGGPGVLSDEDRGDNFISSEKELELRRMKAQAEADRSAKRKRKGPRF